MYKSHMRLAIEKAREADSAFGAVLAMGDQVAVSVSDADPAQYDPTGHAILQALRELGKLTHEIRFPGYSLYTTVEPCPMCAAACITAHLEAVYFGIALEELSLGQERYPEALSASKIFNLHQNPPALGGGILADECRELLHFIQ